MKSVTSFLGEHALKVLVVMFALLVVVRLIPSVMIFPKRNTQSVECVRVAKTLFSERISMGLSLFEHNTRNAKIQGLSVQAGELFADMYKDQGADANDTLEALEAYKSLRRLLPREDEWDDTSRHTGATAAHKATQGVS